MGEKMNLQSQIEDMSSNVDASAQRCHLMEKKAKNFDKLVIEWKHKIDALQGELDQSQVECRSYSTDLFKVKTIYEESQQQLDGVRRENKNLSNEIKDIMDQIGEGGRNIHEIDKIRKRLENETRAKGEGIRQKKKLEADTNDLDIALEPEN